MLSVLDAYTADLPATKTYGRRSFTWTPASSDSDGRIGNLVIKVQKSKRGVGRSVECDTYAVEQDPPTPQDFDGLAFWLHNLTDTKQDQPYRCVVGGLYPTCTCAAGQCGIEACKHRDAMAAVIEAGLLES